MFNFLQICLFQEAPKVQKAGKLLDILGKRDNKLVPLFLRALEENDQPYVARMLAHEGLHTFGVVVIINCAAIVCCHN